MAEKKEDFRSTSEKIYIMENKIIQPSEFKGEVTSDSTVVLSPEEYGDTTYEDMLNMYSRMDKIRKLSERFLKEEKITGTEKKAAEEAAKNIEKVAKEHSALEIEEAKAEKPPIEPEIEMPAVPAPEEKVPEYPEKEVVVPKIVKPPEIKEEKPPIEPVAPLEEITAKDLPYIASHKLPILPDYSLLSVDPDKFAEERFREIIQKTSKEVPKMNKKEIKSRMLELTKQLFREKSSAKREEIKREIVSLKEMLSSPLKGAKKPKLKDILIGEQEIEFFNSRREFESLVRKEIRRLRKEFYEVADKIPKEDTENMRKAVSLMTADFNEIKKQASDNAEKISEFFINAHSAMLELASKEEKIRTEKEIEKIKQYCPAEMSITRRVFSDYADGIIEKASYDTGISADENLKPLYQAYDMSEEQLLNYLQSHLSKKYGEYEQNRITKQEALVYALMKISEEKGLSNELLKKYFSSVIK
ncbi:hypothetical protein JXB01_02515 [Candidatus Micrarchaeota archaeon]|nr:hypothetical protein [Candidatus Micrarchaeota archaeon]